MDSKWIKMDFILVLIAVLLVPERQATAAGMVNIFSAMHTTGRIPCHHGFPHDSVFLAKWTKSKSDESYVTEGRLLLVTWERNGTVNEDHYGIDNDDLSLVISNVQIKDEGIYRCTVYQERTSDISETDTKLSVYKYPDDPPALISHIHNDEIEFKCSVGYVYPLNHPRLSVPHDDNHTVLVSENGTYHISVRAVFPYDESDNEFMDVECFFSHQDKHWFSILKAYRGKWEVPVMPTESGSQFPSKSTDICTTEEKNVNDPAVTSILAIVVILVILWIPFYCVGIKIIIEYLRINRRVKKARRIHDPIEAMRMFEIFQQEQEEHVHLNKVGICKHKLKHGVVIADQVLDKIVTRECKKIVDELQREHDQEQDDPGFSPGNNLHAASSA